jgi:hypothetical protein
MALLVSGLLNRQVDGELGISGAETDLLDVGMGPAGMRGPRHCATTNTIVQWPPRDPHPPIR